MLQITVRWPLALGSMVWLTLVACGGGAGGASASSADSSGATESNEDSATGSETTDEASSSESGAPRTTAPRASARAACAAGGCSECGEGSCPLGMFCVKSSNGNGCSWFPECGNNADCSCIGKHLGSECRCEAQGSFARVTCQD